MPYSRLNKKFSDEVIGEIRWLTLNTTMRPTEIASHYGIPQSRVSLIKTNAIRSGAQPRKPDWYVP